MKNCDVCGEELSERENQIYDEISNDNLPCFCSVAKRIAELESGVVRDLPVIKLIDGLDKGGYEEYINDDKEYLITRLK